MKFTSTSKVSFDYTKVGLLLFVVLEDLRLRWHRGSPATRMLRTVALFFALLLFFPLFPLLVVFVAFLLFVLLLVGIEPGCLQR